jgi:capsular polysaccharide transport system ATP-binding protein
VELGYSLGILAPNGTGKTTLIKMMAGLEKPDEGQIYRNCRISFPLGFMGGVIGKLTRHRKRPLHRAALRARPRLCRSVLPLGLRDRGIFRHAHRHLFVGDAARFNFSLLLALDFDIYLIDEGMPPPRTPSSTAAPAASWPTG